MMERISQSCSTGAAVNLSEQLLLLSSGTITRVAFGKKYEGEEERKNKFADLAAELTTLMGAFFVGDYFPSFAWVDVLTGMDARLKRNHGELDAFVDQVIDDHLVSRKVNGLDGAEQKDLVDVLLHLQKDSSLGVHLNRNNLKAVILVGHSYQILDIKMVVRIGPDPTRIHLYNIYYLLVLILGMRPEVNYISRTIRWSDITRLNLMKYNPSEDLTSAIFTGTVK
ncbi:Cytochrome P450 71A1 [Cinnamomum micranthum f. kanehirae]|uniref:Cytochrome P450 71A1 n=1 Tax=Cinnamomum micranthum f. kanehirae TaxID=337451 RepID=A0A443Q5C2_9MAGN|nr:Cytochrome P450 71A1 [Cinnamomum micranthum f. kanehirae]